MLAFTLTRVLLHGARCFASDEPGPLGGALVSELLAQVARVIPCGGGWGGGAPAPCAKVADAARTSVGPNACGGDVYNTCGWSVGFAEHDELGSHTLIWRRLSLRVGGGGGCLGGTRVRYLVYPAVLEDASPEYGIVGLGGHCCPCSIGGPVLI